MELEQIFASCQRKPHAAAYGYASKLIAYTSHNAVALYDPFCRTRNGPFVMLRGHTGKVQSVEWISRKLNGKLVDVGFVTSSADKTIRLWTENGACTQVLKGHNDNVLVLGTLGATDSYQHDIIASGSCDGKIFIWKRSVEQEGAFSLVSW